MTQGRRRGAPASLGGGHRPARLCLIALACATLGCASLAVDGFLDSAASSLDAGEYTRALYNASTALVLADRWLPNASVELADAYEIAGASRAALGRHRVAVPDLERSLAIRLRLQGAQHASTLRTMQSLGTSLIAVGEMRRGIAVHREMLGACIAHYGADAVQTVACRTSLADSHLRLGDREAAAKLLGESLRILDRAEVEDDASRRLVLLGLARAARARGNLREAESLIARAIDGPARSGEARRLVAAARIEMGSLQASLGNFSRARALLESALEQRASSEEGERVAPVLARLAEIYTELGLYRLAREAALRAVAWQQAQQGEHNASTAESFSLLARAMLALGDYAGAERYLSESLEISCEIFGPEHPISALRLSRLASLYLELGDYSRALGLNQAALALLRRATGPDQVWLADVMMQQGLAQQKLADLIGADRSYRAALELRMASLPEGHPAIARTLRSLGSIRRALGQRDEAEALFRRALRVRRRSFDRASPWVAESLSDLAAVALDSGRLSEAAENLERALEIQSSSLGPHHRKVGATARSLAWVYLRQARRDRASELAQRALLADWSSLAEILSFTSERERLAFLTTFDPYSVFASLGDARGVATALFRFKGIVLDSVLENRRARSGGTTTGRPAAVSVEQVQRALPRGAVFVDIVRYSHALPEGAFEDRYGAVLLASGAEPRWVPLAPAAEIDAAVDTYRRLMQGSRGSDALARRRLGELYERVWAPLARYIPDWCEVVLLSPDSRLHLVSFPTLLDQQGRLLAERYSFLLVSSARDLLASDRAPAAGLLAIFADPVFGDTPSPGSAGSAGSGARRPHRSLLPRLPGTGDEARALARLAHRFGWPTQSWVGSDASEAELRTLHSPWILHIATHGLSLGSGDPSSSGARGVGGIRFDADARDARSVELGRRVGAQPEPRNEEVAQRGALALAGAGSALDAWVADPRREPAVDGVLLADEAAALDLRDTWLVVLAACDTGTGEVRDGEGVLGLRRGFELAGARNIVVTLWSPTDRETSRLIADVYTKIRSEARPILALSKAQRNWLVRLRRTHGLLRAVRIAGPFVMSFRGTSQLRSGWPSGDSAPSRSPRHQL